jgi:hypothetical protein
VNRKASQRRQRYAHAVAVLVGVVIASLVWLLAGASVALAAGNDVGANLASLLEGYAGELYGGIVAVISLVFLINRRYTELMVFLLAAVVVAWMVFAPGEIGTAAQAIGKQIFG